jgi:hypothetical protein
VPVIRMRQQDCSESEPFVMRHCRQEWHYQADPALAYEGADAWFLRKIPEDLRRGAWVQAVDQIDDSPRYSELDRWQHGDSFSTWISDEARRPLPRREWSARQDNQVLVGTNRHAVMATGWLQEENNLKLVLDAAGRPRETLPDLAREYGVARYDRIKDFDFSALA